MPRDKLDHIIARLEKQRQQLKEIIDGLHEVRLLGFSDFSSMSLEEFEKRLVSQALQRAGGNQTEAARILKVSRDKIRYKMAKHRLKNPVNKRRRVRH
jgi:DNA-binding NtrC family response regulator